MENSRNRKLTTHRNQFNDSDSDNPSHDIDLPYNNEEDESCGKEDHQIIQWLQALDTQVIGACRTDERLKPLLKFEGPDVGLLARCFRVPLVSVRVGKIDKRGTLFCPTNVRGNLNVTLLPTSALRISFVGDNGNIERLASLSSQSQCAAVVIKEIPSDNSRRSFLIRISENRVFYFWCSEKSKLLGNELLSKMKDILRKKPSVAELTGISVSRLGFFASTLHAFLVESKVSSGRANSSDTFSPCMNIKKEFSDTASAYLSSNNSLESRQLRKPSAKANSLHQSNLSPRSSFSKDGLSRGSFSSKSTTKEKSGRHVDRQFLPVNDFDIASSFFVDLPSPKFFGTVKLPETIEGFPTFPPVPSSRPEMLGKSAVPALGCSVPHFPSFSSALLSPYYCWCPPVASGLEHSVAVASFPASAMELTPHPSSSLLKIDKSTALLMPSKPLDLADFPIEFPTVLPDSLVHAPFPSTQQITFTPVMCDPIVHIPVIDVCSSGQGYLVSAGSAITTVSPLHPNLLNPLLPNTDPVVVKGAQETLRRLISSSVASSPQLLEVMPAIFTTADESRSVFAMGSRGLYSGTLDVNAAVASSVASLGNSESKVLTGSNAEASCGGGDNMAQKE